MNRILSSLSLFVLAIPALNAAPIASTSCYNQQGTASSVVVGEFYCLNRANNGYSTAQVSSSYTIGNSSLQFSSQASILGGGGDILNPSVAGASAQISETLQIGFPGASSGSGLVFGSVAIDRVSNGGIGVSTAAYFPDYFAQQFPGVPNNLYPTTIQLGVPFTITLTSSASGSARASESAAGFLAGIRLDLRFTQADGVTPLAIAEVPEPSTWALVGLMMLFGLGWNKRRPAAKSPSAGN